MVIIHPRFLDGPGIWEISDKTMSNRNRLSRVGGGFMALLLAVTPALAGSTFCDKFVSKKDPAWGDQDGSWTIAKHRYYATMPNNDPLTYCRIARKVTSVDV